MKHQLQRQGNHSWVHGGTIGKTKIILLHGYADSAFLFSKLIGKIESNYEVFALNLPMTENKYKIYDVDGLASFVISFSKTLGIRDYILVGFSLGGMVATKVASMDERNVKGLILLNSLPSLVSNKILRRYINKFSPLWRKRQFLFLVSRLSASKLFRIGIGRKNIREDELLRMKENYISIFGTLFSVIGSSLEKEFCALNIPKMVKMFKDDEILKYKGLAKYLSKIASDVETFDNGGHASKPEYWDTIALTLNNYSK